MPGHPERLAGRTGKVQTGGQILPDEAGVDAGAIAQDELVPGCGVDEGLEAAVESGSYWVGVVGTPESRRPVVLGAVVVDVMAMLELHAELAAPILVGERASALLAAPAAPLGRFVLPGQARPKTLHRVDAPLPAA